MSVLNSTTQVIVEPAARLTVGRDLEVAAATVDRNATWGRATVDPRGAVGIAVAVSVEQGETTAALDGTANVTGNVSVTAGQSRQPVAANRTYVIPSWFTGVSASAAVGTTSTGTLLDDLKSLVTAAGIDGALKGAGLAKTLVGMLITAIADKERGYPKPPGDEKPSEPIVRRADHPAGLPGRAGGGLRHDENTVTAAHRRRHGRR